MRITIIQGHPTPGGGHLLHALADAYATGAAGAGHEVRRIAVADLNLPLVHSKAEWEEGRVPPAASDAQRDIGWAEHLVIFFPLWQGDMPAVLKGFFEQVFRPGFAFETGAQGQRPKLKGRSARLVVTMGMPAFLYRWWFGAHAVKALKQGMLGMVGIGPVRESLLGLVEGKPARRERWLRDMAELGRAGR